MKQGQKSTMDSEDESTQLMTVNVYDTHSATTILKVNNETRACDICKAIAHKFDISSDNAKFHSLVLVLTAYNSVSKFNTHCVRTLTQYEYPLEIRGILISKLIDKYNLSDSKEVANSVRWFYKDIRTSPIEFGDSGEVCGEYSSDDEEVISHSDLAYLAKAERKGYLLKRSSKDQNLWRRWYCALTDHLWCVDINREDPRAICIKLSGMIRYKQGNHSALDQVQTIIINSLKQTHFFRAFNVVEHRKWIEDLYVKTNYATDNDYFSMAEVIICDEELTKSKRIHKQVQDMLDIEAVYESLSETRVFSLESSGEAGGPALSTSASAVSPERPLHGGSRSDINQDTTDRLALINPAAVTSAAADSRTDAQFVSDLAAAVDDLMVESLHNDGSTYQYTQASSEEYHTLRSSNSLAYDSVRNSAAHTPLSRSTGSFASVINSTNTAVDLAFAEAYPKEGDEEEQQRQQREEEHKGPPPPLSPFRPPLSPVAGPSRLSFAVPSSSSSLAAPVALDPLNRSRRHSLVHRLHHKNKLLFRMMSFVLEVQYFKELFRHDLVVGSNEQIERAILLHSRYLVPQLLAVGLFLGSNFISQYATKMTSTPVKKSRPPREVTTINIKANGTIVMTPKQQAPGGNRQRSRSERSPLGSFAEPDASSSTKATSNSTSRSGRKKSQHSRSNSRNDLNHEEEEQEEAHWANSTSEESTKRVSVLWGISTEVLLKIHLILFDTQDISSADIDKYGLTDFVHTLNSIKSTLNDGNLEMRGKSSKKSSFDASAGPSAAAAAPSGFWSLFSSPSNPSSGSAGASQPSSGKEAAAVERVPVGSDLFDDVISQLLEIMHQR